MEWTARAPKDTRENLNEIFVRQSIDPKRLVDLSTWAKHKHLGRNAATTLRDLSKRTPENLPYYTNIDMIPRNIRGGLGPDGKPLMTATGENIDERIKRRMEETLHEVSTQTDMFDNFTNYERYISDRILGLHKLITDEITNEMGLKRDDYLSRMIPEKLGGAIQELAIEKYKEIIKENPKFNDIHESMISTHYGNENTFLRQHSGALAPKIRMLNDINEKAGITMEDSLKDVPLNEYFWPLDEFGEPLTLQQMQILTAPREDRTEVNPMQATWEYLKEKFGEQERHKSLGELGQEKLLQPLTTYEMRSKWFKDRMEELGQESRGRHIDFDARRDIQPQRPEDYIHPDQTGTSVYRWGQEFQNFYSWPEIQQATEEYRGLENDDTN